MEQRDLSQSTQYLFIIGENRDITYQAQSSNVANLTLGTAVLGAQAKDVFIPGNKLTTDPLYNF